MKILHTVESYYPSVGGMQEVVKQLSEHLVKLGHEVTVATAKIPERKERLLNGVKIIEFNISRDVDGRFSGDIENYKKLLLSSSVDVITNFAAQQWATDLMLPLLENIKAKKVFVPTGFSGLFIPQYKTYFDSMKSWLHQYDMNVFLSNDYRDINFARDCGVKNISVIPNGAGEDEFLALSELNIRKSMNIPPDHFLILHVGSHTGTKGHAEAIQIFRKARIKAVTFLIIANDINIDCATNCKRKALLINLWNKFLKKRLVVTALSRAETIAAFKEADLFLFPSNIECSPLVLFEAMASKTPFLTTDVGNSAEIIEWSKAGMMLPTVKDSKGHSSADISGSAIMLEEIHGDLKRRERMQKSGFEAWQKSFTWRKIAKKYEDMYLKLTQGEGESVLND